jgi:hypothetical protein
MTDGSDQLGKVIATSLLPLDSCNPFNEEDVVGDRFVFAIPNERTQADVTTRVRGLFSRLEAQGRAKLVSGFPRYSKGPDGTFDVEIRYRDLKANKEADVTVSVAGNAALLGSL